MGNFPWTVYLDTNAVLTQSASRRYPLGTRGLAPDGRVFRYCKFATGNTTANCAAGRVVMSALQSTLGTDSTNGPLTTDESYGGTTMTSTFDRITISTTWDVILPGDTYGQSTGVMKDQFKDGMIAIAAGTNVGQSVRIKGNTTGSTGVAGQTVTFTFKDNDRFVNNVTTSDELVVLYSIYDRVTLELGYGSSAEAADAVFPIGVTPRPITAGYYFWAQTWGMCTVLQATTGMVAGQNVVYSTDEATSGAVSGAITLSTGLDGGQFAARPRIGQCVAKYADTEYCIINLTIAP